MSYHDRIMNLQLPDGKPEEFLDYGQRLQYKEGHRDARHSAAEMAIQADETIRCMTETLDKIGAMLGVEPGDVDGIGAAIEGLSRHIDSLDRAGRSLSNTAYAVWSHAVLEEDVDLKLKHCISNWDDTRERVFHEIAGKQIDKALAAGEADHG